MENPKEFKKQIEKIISELNTQGLDFRLIELERHPLKQAKYYRKGRSTVEIANAINSLKAKGCNFLAQCIESVGPQTGNKKITWVYPGFSWHQWEEAADIWWFHNDKFVTDAEAIIGGIKGYELLAKTGIKYNLTSGYYWKTQDAVHLQNRKHGVKSYFEDQEVDFYMEQKYSNDLNNYLNNKKDWWTELDHSEELLNLNCIH